MGQRTHKQQQKYNTAYLLPLPCVGFGAHVYHCKISPPRFLAECRKRRLNQGGFVLLCFKLSALFDLYLVFACLFSCTVFVLSFCMFIFLYCFFVSISQVTGCEDRLWNDLYCVGWGVKLCSLTHSLNDESLNYKTHENCAHQISNALKRTLEAFRNYWNSQTYPGERQQFCSVLQW